MITFVQNSQATRPLVRRYANIQKERFMGFINWDSNNICSLGRVFLRHVFEHMRGLEESTVRFGITGQGVMPNYQVTFPNGVTRTFRGSSHKSYEQAEEFNNQRISQPFDFAIIKKAYESA